jgi:hypothetical protein
VSPPSAEGGLPSAWAMPVTMSKRYHLTDGRSTNVGTSRVAKSPSGLVERHRVVRALAVAAIALCVASASAASASARAGRVCRVPRLKGLTLTVARTRASHAGCTLRVKGGALKDAGARIVERQSPGAHTRSASVTVWLSAVPVDKNDGSQAGQALPVAPVAVPPQSAPKASPLPPGTPTCAVEGLPVSGSRNRELEGPFENLHVTPGPAELVSGFYIGGGPPPPPGCELPETPSPGVVEVMNAHREVVATQTSEVGHLVEIPLPPGSYTIASTFVSASFCEGATGTETCVHPHETYSVTIQAGFTVRKDFLLSVP